MPILESMAVTSTDLPLRAGGDYSVITVGKILERGYSTVTVSIFGGAPVQVPAASGDWKTVQAAHILVNPITGRPVYALAPAPATYPDPRVPRRPPHHRHLHPGTHHPRLGQHLHPARLEQ